MKAFESIRPHIKSHKKLVQTLVFVVAAGIISWIAISLYQNQTRNYAEVAAQSLEHDLVKAGGVKTFSGGEAGRSSDNIHPYYDTIYEFSLNKSAVVTLVDKIARDNGFRLTHASPGNKGQLENVVADEFIDSWYFDNSSKASTFSDLAEGKVKLAIQVGYDNESESKQSDQTKVRINIQMPELKR